MILRTLKDEFLTDPRALRVVAVLRKAASASEPVDFQRQIADLTEDEKTFLSGIALEDCPEPTETSVDRLLKDLEKKYLDRESAEIQQAIVRAGDSERDLEPLLRRKDENRRRRAELGR